ncbi:hypothetical protein SynMITS9220_00671 [Synechococcus sp. MIT S9220]|nr:hypothetical protein SynMITS9220_00671 [Synechococcus sp. MIT S9220]
MAGLPGGEVDLPMPTLSIINAYPLIATGSTFSQMHGAGAVRALQLQSTTHR